MSCSDWPFIPAIPFWDCISRFSFQIYQRCCFERQRVLLLRIKAKERRRKGVSHVASSCRCSTAATVLGRLPLLSLGLAEAETMQRKVDVTHGRRARQTLQNTEVRIADPRSEIRET
jgi:hypothetical protein